MKTLVCEVYNLHMPLLDGLNMTACTVKDNYVITIFIACKKFIIFIILCIGSPCRPNTSLASSARV